jgi:hypothetical protein
LFTPVLKRLIIDLKTAIKIPYCLFAFGFRTQDSRYEIFYSFWLELLYSYHQRLLKLPVSILKGRNVKSDVSTKIFIRTIMAFMAKMLDNIRQKTICLAVKEQIIKFQPNQPSNGGL